MPISLFDASVRVSLQAVRGVEGFLAKAKAALQEEGRDVEALLESRLAPDMLPLRYQVESVVNHSQGALEGVRAGRYRPGASDPNLGWADLEARVRGAASALEGASPEEIEGLIGREVLFEAPSLKLRFAAEDFLISFSLPNLLFHAATAYDLLRMAGAPLGKRDFLGPVRFKI